MDDNLKIKSLRNNLPKQSDVTLSISTILPTTYIEAATASNTRKAYQSDIRQFIAWGGLLPSTVEQVIQYLHAEAPRLNPKTLSRRLTAISHWHNYQHMPDPTKHPLISKTLTGIANTHGKPANKAPALTLDHLEKIITFLNTQPTLSQLRNSALLLIGFLGALRRSELVAIEVTHINWVKEGVEILIPRSKTDKAGMGKIVALPYGNEKLCAVTALANWLKAADIQTGWVFRSLTKAEHIKESGLTPGRVNGILKQTLQKAGIQEASTFSGHSLRRGFATEASRKALSLSDIMRHGRWKSERTVLGYIEEGQRFTDNAVKKLLG